MNIVKSGVGPIGPAPCFCAQDPDIRVLRRVSNLQSLITPSRVAGEVRRVAVVDTETTGLDPAVDEVFDLAVAILNVDSAGNIVEIVSTHQLLRDPGRPIPPVITKLTGVSNDDVRGRNIDLEPMERRLMSADVLIAHNARFDITFIEKLFPSVRGAAWGCSASDFDWPSHGFDGRKLGHLLMQIGFFNDAHRAAADVISLTHLLAHRLPHGGTILADILARAEQPSFHVEATGAPFEQRSRLKARGYRWDAKARVWWMEVRDDDLIEEERWLRTVLPAALLPKIRKITWHERHR